MGSEMTDRNKLNRLQRAGWYVLTRPGGLFGPRRGAPRNPTGPVNSQAISPGQKRSRRILLVIVALVALVFLSTLAVAARLAYQRYTTEQRAAARLDALDASFGRAATVPPWLARLFRRLRLPVPTSIGGIDDVGPAFCDSDLALLRYCSHVGNLDLDRTQVTNEGMVHLKHFTGLYILELDETRITNAGLAHLRALPGLRCLTLAGTSISDAGLEHLAHLESLVRLDLSNTGVTDQGLVHLAELRNLERLDLAGTRVTQDGITDLKRRLANIEIRGP